MKGHVNASGFPLQIAVSNAINRSSGRIGWRTRYTEHAWSNKENGERGFIDLVLENEHSTQFLVVECKRVKDTSWIFLTESNDKSSRRHAKCFVLNREYHQVNRFEWTDLTLDPSSPQAKFCVVPGHNGSSQSLIERAAAELVSSTEGLAQEDLVLGPKNHPDLRIYFNAIVTTAPLHICHVDPESISLKDGTLTDPEFEEVPYVRFRKQLNPIFEIPDADSTISDHERARAKENTVFIINATHLVEFLEEFEIDDGYPNARHLR